MSLRDVVEDIAGYVASAMLATERFRIMVASDAVAREGKGETVSFATAIVVHQIGHGARFYVTRTVRDDIPTFRDRIYTETMLSITLAQELRSRLASYMDEDFLRSEYFVIDADVGENGKSKVLIREIIGMVTGNGFHVRVKPDAEGVHVADKFVRPVTPRVALESA